MTTLREAAMMALEALYEETAWFGPTPKGAAAIAALKAALAQQDEPVQEPVQEPVAWIHTDPDKPRVKFLEWSEDEPGYRGCWIKTPLYLSPPQRKPLTEKEIIDAVREADLDWTRGWTLDETQSNRFVTLARAIERAHGIGVQS